MHHDLQIPHTFQSLHSSNKQTMASRLAKPRRWILLVYKWICKFVFWTPGIDREQFLTEKSEAIYKLFRYNTFLFSQLNQLFIFLGLLSFSLLLYSVLARREFSCRQYIGPLVHSISLAFHVLCFFLKHFLPKVFHRCHILIELLSFIFITMSTNWATDCGVVANFGLVNITFSAFRILVATVYFQYSTLLIIIASVAETLSPIILLNSKESSHPVHEVRTSLQIIIICYILSS